jgi:hypothetical protein
LLDAVTIWVEIFVPFVAPFLPSTIR